MMQIIYQKDDEPKYKKKICSISVIIIFALTLVISSFIRVNTAEDDVKEEVVVAVIDTGLNLDKLVDDSRINLVDDDISDEFGHGTEIVSLILHNTADNVKVMPIKVTDDDGSAAMSDLCAGIRKAVENGADIINLSMNTAFYTDDNELELLINDLHENGIYTVVSAGNDRENTKYLSPANIEASIVVSAVDKEGKPYYYTNYGDTVDVAAYGAYNGKFGTSFAAAYVTSLCANLLGSGETDIESQLLTHTTEIGDTKEEQYYGCGYIDVPVTSETNKSSDDASASYIGIRNKIKIEKGE